MLLLQITLNYRLYALYFAKTWKESKRPDPKNETKQEPNVRERVVGKSRDQGVIAAVILQAADYFSVL